jgi:hypothetical protein
MSSIRCSSNGLSTCFIMSSIRCSSNGLSDDKKGYENMKPYQSQIYLRVLHTKLTPCSAVNIYICVKNAVQLDRSGSMLISLLNCGVRTCVWFDRVPFQFSYGSPNDVPWVTCQLNFSIFFLPCNAKYHFYPSNADLVLVSQFKTLTKKKICAYYKK